MRHDALDRVVATYRLVHHFAEQWVLRTPRREIPAVLADHLLGTPEVVRLVAPFQLARFILGLGRDDAFRPGFGAVYTDMSVDENVVRGDIRGAPV